MNTIQIQYPETAAGVGRATHVANAKYVARGTRMRRTARFAGPAARVAHIFVLPTPRSTGSVSPVNAEVGSGRGEGSGGWTSQFVGSSGELDPHVLRHCEFNHANCYRAREWAVWRVKGEGDGLVCFTFIPDTHLDARPDYYPTTDTEAIVSPYGTDLLRTYFEVIHHSYPLLDPARFAGTPQTGDPLLATIYALAAPFCPSSPAEYPSLAAFIHQVLPIENRHPRLETLEAAILFLQRLNAPTTLPGHSSTLGSVVGIAHDLGLNNDPSTWALSPADCSRRIRIWWALYIQDKWTALGLGRPSYLNDEHCNVPFPTIAHFSHLGLSGEQLGLAPALQFIAMAHLSSILSDILSNFYALKAVERMKLLPDSMVFSMFSGFKDQLRLFRDEHLCQLWNSNSGTGLDHSGSAILAFYTAEIVLLRAVLRVLPMHHPGHSGVRAQARTVLLNVVEFLEKMTTTKTNISLAGTFMFSQLLTSHTTHDIEFWSSTIAHFRSLLRAHAHSSRWEMTELACRRLDLLAAGMGVDSPVTADGEGMLERDPALSGSVSMEIGGLRAGEIGPGGGEGQLLGARRVAMDFGGAEDWLMRQGNGGVLLC
ncbi:nitrogen regulatory protein tamA [Diplocarpon mali]|nr:nitrogen regulatory protein tamA [Diplocarpon mali]